MNPVAAIALDMLESAVFGLVIYASVVYIRALWPTLLRERRERRALHG